MTELPRPRRPWDGLPPEQREYFEVLGPGLVAVVPGRAPGGAGSSEWRPPTGGAWVFVGSDDRLLGFTGKAEVGQGTRGALTLVVAEELRVAPARVTLVMGDTDLCPWDMGTFGSRSMPDAAPALATAAAGARERLLELATERARVPRSRLEVEDGTVLVRGTSTRYSFPELVAGGRHLAIVAAGTATIPPTKWERAGRGLVDPHAEEVVQGRRRYVSDLVRPGMLHGAVLWPPSYGARLLRAPSELPVGPPGATVVREGSFVGAVAGSAVAARRALQQLPVTWEVPPQPGESTIEGHLRSQRLSGDDWDTDEDVAGDVDAAMAEAPWKVSATYRSAYIAHVPLEPHCAVAEWDGGRVTIWVGSQTPFRVRGEVARALRLAEEEVRVIVPPTGSGFGGKHGGEVATAAARLARAAGRPVRVAFSREEEFRYAYLRPMSLIDVRAAAGPSGKLVAWSFFNVNGGAAALRAPYTIPHRKVGNALSRSPLPQGSLRALAANPNNFARESALDELAGLAGIDPLEFRERNLEDPRLLEVLRRATDRAGWRSRARAPGQGSGLALGLEKGARVATVAQVTVAADRRVHVDRLTTAFEAGTVVNPDNLRSQVEGAQMMALGEALFEAIHFDAGVLRNPRLSQYRVPRFSDLPEIDIELVDAKEFPPAGAGETPMITVAPAVANALFDACHCRLRSLPLVPHGRVPSAPAG